jgi:DNA-directed RNA polymerase beta subunit
MADVAPFPTHPDELKPFNSEEIYGPIAKTVLPEGDPARLDEDDMLKFAAGGLAASGLVGYNLDSYNKLIEMIPKIVTEMFRIDITTRNLRLAGPNGDIDHYRIQVTFLDAEVKRPVQATFPSGQTKDHYPCMARNTGSSYSGPFLMSAQVTIEAHYKDGRVESKNADIPKFEVSQFPIMVGSTRCHTYNLTREARKLLQEDPRERGGYFIAKGEWSVELLENIRFNSLHVYLAIKREVVRGEFISQPGGAFENSSQIVIRLLKSGLITIEVNSMKFQKLQVPFYLFFRIFGMVNDRDILTNIVSDVDSTDPVVREQIDVIDKALHMSSPNFENLKDELDRQVITENLAVRLERFVTNHHNYKSDEEAVRFLTTSLLAILDKVFLPHVGQGPESRTRKLRFLGMLINKMLLVSQGVAPPADRDSLAVKRVHGSGVSLAKAFKAMFNSAVIAVILASLKLELKQLDFARLTQRRIAEACRMMLTASPELNRLLIQALTSGNRIMVVRRRALLNRLASNPIERKSPLNLVSSLRRITSNNASSATKGTTRATMIRAVHPLALGFVCPYHSADTGENVGMEKQLACTADVCDASDTYPLIARLVSDPEVFRLNTVTNLDIARRGLCRIFVNGDWVGCCEKPHELRQRYVGLRRQGYGLTPRTTISWLVETNEIEFWLDVGRLTRPLLIVDNNQAEFDAGDRAAHAAKQAGAADWESHRVKFVQNVRYTKEHARLMRAGALTVAGLVELGVCEFVTPEEIRNCLLAETVDHLQRNAHNVLRPYTHCDVPQALVGLAALVSPFANHTQPARVTYETNQVRATCGWYCGSWPWRADQLRFFQFYDQWPLIHTLSNEFVLPSGMNTLMGYMTWKGIGQEDSAVVKQDAISAGLYAGVLFRKETVTLETGEHFGSPDATTTRNMRAGASYSKLVEGFVTPGTQVKQGDVIIGRLAKEAAETGGKGRTRGRDTSNASATYVDRSIVYKEEQPARVDAVWSTTAGTDDSTFVLVKLVYMQMLNIGDKMSSRSGNKSIVASALPACDLPYDEEGNRPDIMINPHSIPSRMVIGQPIEAYLGLAAARSGAVIDGTMFRKLNLKAFGAVVKKLGFRESGHRRMFDPHTGDPMTMAVFLGPTYQQRLQKFVDLNRYAAPVSGPTDPITGQPREGKRYQGGMRYGEMERWVLVALGLANVLNEKCRNDADGRVAYYCRGCGQPAVYNAALLIYKCPKCKGFADIAAVPSTQASLVFQHELRATGIDLRMEFAPLMFEEYMAESANDPKKAGLAPEVLKILDDIAAREAG